MRITRNHRNTIALLQGLLLLVFAPLAAAYIGPGSGISVIGSLLALLATVGLAVLAIFLFPFRKMMKKRNQEAEAEDVQQDDIAVAKERTEGS